MSNEGAMLTGAAIGLGIAHIRNKRRRDLEGARILQEVNSLSVAPIVPPLPATSWFSTQKYGFGLPSNFIRRDPGGDFGKPPPAFVVSDADSHMWLTVLENRSLTMQLDRGFTPWIVVPQPDAFRRLMQSWGGTVVEGPIPILLDGEQAVWSNLSMIEGGVEQRKWVAYVLHNGICYEAVMGVHPRFEAAFAAAFWTMVGSWRWLDRPGAAQPSLPQPSAPMANTMPALMSPDGKYWWDGRQWNPVPPNVPPPPRAE